MQLLYLTPDSWKRDRHFLAGIMDRLGLQIEGMHCFCDFPNDPETSRYREMINLAKEAGAGNFLIIPGMFSSGNTERDLRRMVEGVKRTVEYGESKNLPILMEDFDGILSPYNSIAGLNYFMRSVENLGCAFDTGNFAMFRENELEAFDLFADRIRTVHLKDRSHKKRHSGDTPFLCSDGNPVYACAIGSGYIHIDEILNRLRQRNYAGNVIVELYAIDSYHVVEDAIESISWVRTQLEKRL